MKKYLSIKAVILMFNLFIVSINSQWVQTNGNFGIEHRVNCIITSNQKLFVGTWGAGIFESNDNGINWIEKNNGLTNLIVRNIFVKGTKMFAGTRKGIFVSTDDGNLWTPINNGLPVVWINGEAFIDIFSIISDGQNIFTGTYGGVYVLLQDSTNWIPRRNGLTGSAVLDLIIKDSYLFAGTYWETFPGQGGDVFSSSNYGLEWNIVSNGLPAKIINDFTSTEENLFVAVNAYNGIYRTSDFGENWFPSNPIISSTPNCLLAHNIENVHYLFSGNYYPNNEGSILYVSTNEGENWISISDNLPNLSYSIVMSLSINDQYIFAGVNSIVWRRPVQEILEITKIEQDESQMSFEIFHNFPNPFNASTIIRYHLPTVSNVTIKVYDLLGKEVKTLVDEEKSAGVFEIIFNGEGLSSGFYFYSIQAGDFHKTRKMILLR